MNPNEANALEELASLLSAARRVRATSARALRAFWAARRRLA
jgi:hypothetical protein